MWRRTLPIMGGLVVGVGIGSLLLAQVQPGAINDRVGEAAAPYGLRFGPDPATHAWCTIGGNIATNACGVHSLQARFDGRGSRTSDNVERLEVLTYDGLRMWVGPTPDDEVEAIIAGGGRRGQIYHDLRDLRDRHAGAIRQRFPAIPRRVSGYNLDELLPERGFNLAAALAGTEGTCVRCGRSVTLATAPRGGVNAARPWRASETTTAGNARSRAREAKGVTLVASTAR